MTKARSLILILVMMAVLAVMPAFLSPNLVNAAIKMLIAALFALAFTLAMGQAGMLSFGHAAYYGLGAYAALHMMLAVEQKLFLFPTPLIPLAGGVIGFIFGMIGPMLLGSWLFFSWYRGAPILADFLKDYDIMRLRTGFLLNGVAFGLGLGIVYPLLRNMLGRERA